MSRAGQMIDERAHLLATSGDTERLDELTAALHASLGDGRLGVRALRLPDDRELVERLGAAEVVHPLRGPGDLEDRVDADRRCFVLEHPDLPGRPTNVVWVALSRGPFTAIDQILDPAAPTFDAGTADTATFYSIWNVEAGLIGLPGGHDLLVGAVDALRDELPGLVGFRTLSPVPGLRDALDGVDPGHDLARATARYLTTLRSDGRPVDPVARFHLGNGARLAAIYPEGDLSDLGRQRSFGAMCSYRYEPEDRDANRRQLADGSVPVTDEVAGLLRG